MIDQNVVNYIRDARSKNISDDVIKQALILNGWNEPQVAAALAVTNAVETTPVNSAPQPILGGSIKRRANSTLSVLLGIVLFVALFILSNHIVKDLMVDAADVSTQLIINSLIVLPFLLIAFLLHYSFHQNEHKNKYLIIAQPYYFVSAWLLIKLLFKVSSYILDTNAAYGVYVVLVLVIAVLTGIIFFVQRYLKKQ